jgi:hypothetical protein
MLVYTREVMLARLLLVPELINLYQAQDGGFVAAVLQWMNDTEGALKRLRHPLASMCSSQRARVLAALDGVMEGGDARGASGRKAARAAVALCLSHVEGALRQRVAELDSQLHAASEKMAQLLALGSAQHPLPLPPTEPHSQWVRQVWLQLGQVPETRNLHGYLGALLSADDRVAVLSDALSQLLDALPTPP